MSEYVDRSDNNSTSEPNTEYATMNEVQVVMQATQWKAQLDAAYWAGSSKERELVIEWLRRHNYQTAGTILAASAIEKGEHLRGENV